MKTKRKMEFKKKLAVFSVFLILSVTICDFALAFMALPVPETTSYTIASAAFAYLVSYAAASTIEKNSRNKYKIDVDGNPISKIVTEISDNIGG